MRAQRFPPAPMRLCAHAPLRSREGTACILLRPESEHPMFERVAALSCCMSLLFGSVVSAQDAPSRMLTATRASSLPAPGPIRKAIDRQHISAMRAAETQQADASANQSRGNWMERHPVWAGTIVGFGVGFGLTYAAAGRCSASDFICPVSPGG